MGGVMAGVVMCVGVQSMHNTVHRTVIRTVNRAVNRGVNRAVNRAVSRAVCLCGMQLVRVCGCECKLMCCV